MREDLKTYDSEIFSLINDEKKRQEENIELIASENYVSKAVLEANSSVLTNKYAEGKPHKRYYGGCENIDKIEDLAVERCKQLFGCEHVNVQPHSGSNANLAVYLAFLKPGDTVLGMDLTHGGHLSHGSEVNISGLWFNFKHYGVNPKTEMLDYEEIRRIALEVKPKILLCGASAYPRIIDFKKFREIADECGAILMADIAHIAGLVATGNHPDPIPYCDVVTTTTHKTLRGTRGAIIMCKEKWKNKIDKAVFPGLQGGPLEHIIAAKAVGFKQNLEDDYKEYCTQVIKNAKVMANVLIDNGFRLVSGGTDNHLILIDLQSSIQMSGKEAQELLDEVRITTNKNTIPNEKLSPFVTSGLRIGTAAITTRNMKEKEAEQIANLIIKTLKKQEKPEVIKREVLDLSSRFPVYKEN